MSDEVWLVGAATLFVPFAVLTWMTIPPSWPTPARPGLAVGFGAALSLMWPFTILAFVWVQVENKWKRRYQPTHRR